MKPQALVKLSSEEVVDNGILIGIIQRWGHHSGRGNSMYLYEPMDGRPPGLASSRFNALAYLHTVPVEATLPPDPLILREEHPEGVLEKYRERKTRRLRWRWRTRDGRLSGVEENQGRAIEALKEAVGA